VLLVCSTVCVCVLSTMAAALHDARVCDAWDDIIRGQVRCRARSRTHVTYRAA